MTEPSRPPLFEDKRVFPAWPFWTICALIGGSYATLILGLVLADLSWTSPSLIAKVFSDEAIVYSTMLSLISCAISALISLVIAVPTGYLLARWKPRNKNERISRSLIEGILDIPIVLPPLVVGISLLILFRTGFGQWFEGNVIPLTYEISGLILAQVTVACAFAVRAMRTTFDHISERPEQVARTLGASQSQAFWHIAFPASTRGLVSAGTIAWARSLGEFGPVLVFAGATRMKTEVLPTTVFLELSVGNLGSAVTVSLCVRLISICEIFSKRKILLLF